MGTVLYHRTAKRREASPDGTETVQREMKSEAGARRSNIRAASEALR